MDENQSGGEPNWQYKADDGPSDQANAAREDVAAAQQQTAEHGGILVGGMAGAQPVMARPAAGQAEGQIEWTASEFIAHDKPARWYLALAAIAIVVVVIVYISSHDYIAVAAVIIIAIIFGIIAARKPRTLTYQLDDRGLSIAGKLYPYGHFKAFAVAREGAFSSLNLLPLRRFMPILTVYYDPADEEAVSSIVGNHLPLQDRQLDPIDRLLRKIHF